jgi:hypothetical protein
MLVSYQQCPEEGFVFSVEQATGSTWTPVGGRVNEDDTGTLVPVYSQGGPTLVQYGGEPYVFWTIWTDVFEAVLSHYTGSAWERVSIATDSQAPLRVPSAFATSDALYLHYGEPSPTVWNVTAGPPVASGSVALAGDEKTLYTALTSWRGQLVLAYSSGPLDAPLNDTVITTKLAFHDGGTGWAVDPAPIEDTPGHDGVVPFVFTVGGDLHVMYADYTTEGVPPDVSGTPFRFRVKRYDGATWNAVGDESDPIAHSMRFEYLVDHDEVLVNVVRRVGSSSERIVLHWKDGTFDQLGRAVATGVDWQLRPGTIIPPPREQ